MDVGTETVDVETVEGIKDAVKLALVGLHVGLIKVWGECGDVVLNSREFREFMARWKKEIESVLIEELRERGNYEVVEIGDVSLPDADLPVGAWVIRKGGVDVARVEFGIMNWGLCDSRETVRGCARGAARFERDMQVVADIVFYRGFSRNLSVMYNGVTHVVSDW